MELVSLSKIPSASEVQEVNLDEPMRYFRIFQDMEDVCKSNRGIGLAAVQVGLPLKFFLIGERYLPKSFSDASLYLGGNFKYTAYANCKYEAISDQTQESIEGCLSLKDEKGNLLTYSVKRFSEIKVSGFVLNPENPSFEPVELTLKNSSAGIVFQHEIDHQNGILISDIGKLWKSW